MVKAEQQETGKKKSLLAVGNHKKPMRIPVSQTEQMSNYGRKRKSI